MATGRELKGRIKSYEGMRKITSTMEKVAACKLKRALDRVVAARPYAKALAAVIADLYTPELAEQFPLLRQPAKVKRAAVLLLTSNRGLAGAFNANLIREAVTLYRRLESEGAEVELHVVGKKGAGYFRFVGRKPASVRIDIGDRPTSGEAVELVKPLTEAFMAGTLDAVYVVYAKFNSAVSTPPDHRSRAAGHSARAHRTGARLSAVPGCAVDPVRTAAGLRAQRGVSRARGDGVR